MQPTLTLTLTLALALTLTLTPTLTLTNPNPNPHPNPPQAWEVSGELTGSSLDLKDGFLHTSDAQMVRTLALTPTPTLILTLTLILTRTLTRTRTRTQTQTPNPNPDQVKKVASHFFKGQRAQLLKIEPRGTHNPMMADAVWVRSEDASHYPYPYPYPYP